MLVQILKKNCYKVTLYTLIQKRIIVMDVCRIQKQRSHPVTTKMILWFREN